MEVLNQPNSSEDYKPWGMDVNTYSMLMHIAQFAGYIAPLLGFFLPIVMWATQKEHSELIDKHGKNIINWIISLIIYYIISGILVVILIGMVGLFILPIISFIFTLVGAVKAANGEVYDYPFTINFIK